MTSALKRRYCAAIASLWVDRRRDNYQLRNEHKNMILKIPFQQYNLQKIFFLKKSKFKNILMAKYFGTGSQGP